MVVTLIIGMIPTVAFADTDCNHIYENGECIICHEDATSNLESKFNFEISKDKIHPGEEFTVVISSVEAIAKAESITNLQNELDYDKDKVEYISSELNVDPLYIELGIYVQDHRPADYCVAFSRTSTNSSAFDVSVGNMLTVTFKAKTELLVDEALAEFHLVSNLTTDKGITYRTNVNDSLTVAHDMADATYDEASKCKREGCNYTEALLLKQK